MRHIWNFKKKKRRPERTDYSSYKFGRLEFAGYLLAGSGIGILICWLCYRSLYAFPIAIITAVFYLKRKKKELTQKRKNTLLYHFGDFLNSLHTALSTGYSVENGIRTSLEDMRRLHGENDVIVNEIKIMTAGLRLRKTVEELFEDLGSRSGLEDIKLFSELLAISKKQGGSMGKVLADTKRIISEKIDTQYEIEKILSSKVYEHKIMSIMPAAVIIYLRLTFDGFIEQLYGNTAGVIIMTVCLLVYLGAFIMGEKIVRIEI